MIRAGFDIDRFAYFSKSDDDLWVRSRWDHERGVIDVGWHERFNIDEGKVQWIDENGEVSKTEDVRFARYGETPWTSAGEILLDRPGLITFSNKEMRRVIESIMCHTSRLIALGYGDNATSVVEWFERVEDGLFIVAGEYQVESGVGFLHGADGMTFTVQDLENEILTGFLQVGDHERFDMTQDLEIGVLRDFLISTKPS
jgi:hypothetical protein